MSAASVIDWIEAHAPDLLPVVDHDRSTATVAEAAKPTGARWVDICKLPE